MAETPHSSVLKSHCRGGGEGRSGDGGGGGRESNKASSEIQV